MRVILFCICFMAQLFGCSADKISVNVEAKWTNKALNQTTTQATSQQLAENEELRLPAMHNPEIKIHIKVNKEAEKRVLVIAQIVEVDKIVANPRVLTNSGTVATIVTDNIDGMELELKVIPTLL